MLWCSSWPCKLSPVISPANSRVGLVVDELDPPYLTEALRDMLSYIYTAKVDSHGWAVLFDLLRVSDPPVTAAASQCRIERE